MSLAKFQELWSDLDETLKSYKTQAEELRDAPGEPQINDSVTTLHEALVTIRQSQNGLETLLANVGFVRSRLRKLVAELEAVYEDKWAESVARTQVGEYTSGKERDATHKLNALNELIKVRKAKQMLADVEAVYEFINLKYRGIDAYRRDIDTRIRVLNMENF